MKQAIFSKVTGHQLAYLLEMDSFICASEDFLFLLETPILRNTFQWLHQYFKTVTYQIFKKEIHKKSS